MDLSALSWPITTARLSLRPATVDDAATTWPFRQLPSVGEWLTRAPTTFAQHEAQFTDPVALAKTVIVEHDGEVVGDLMLAVADAWAQAEVSEDAVGVQAELGWVISPEHARRGFGIEAARELLRMCFQDLGLRRVSAACFADNEASWRLMEGLGMRREQHSVRDSLHRSGRWLDGYTYALLAEEWSP